MAALRRQSLALALAGLAILAGLQPLSSASGSSGRIPAPAERSGVLSAAKDLVPAAPAFNASNDSAAAPRPFTSFRVTLRTAGAETDTDLPDAPLSASDMDANSAPPAPPGISASAGKRADAQQPSSVVGRRSSVAFRAIAGRGSSVVGARSGAAQPVFDIGDFGNGAQGGAGNPLNRRRPVSPAADVTYTNSILNRVPVTASATVTQTLPANAALRAFTVEGITGATCTMLPAASPTARSQIVCRVPEIPPTTFVVFTAVVRVQDCSVNPVIYTFAVSPSHDPGGVAAWSDERWCVDRYYFPWYDGSPVSANADLGAPSGAATGLAIANPNAGAARVEVTIGGVVRGSHVVPPGEARLTEYPGVVGGPVVVRSLGGESLLVSERTRSSAGFNELPAVAVTDFGPRKLFPWYDGQAAGTEAALLVANPSPTATLRISVAIGGAPLEVRSLAPSSVATLVYPGVVGGPVEIEALDGLDLYATERVRSARGFDEFVGLAGGSFEWWAARYDASARFESNSLVFAYPGPPPDFGAAPAEVTVSVYVRQTLRDSVVIPLQRAVRRSYPGLNDGPIVVTVDGSAPILVSQRTTYLGTLNETMLASFGQLREGVGGLYLPYYDGRSADPPTILIANPFDLPAHGTISIGTLRQAFDVPGQTTVALSFPGVAAGPVTIRSADPILAALRAFQANGYEEIYAEPLADDLLAGPPPPTAPVTPVIPELSPSALFAGGLLALGLVGLRRQATGRGSSRC